MVVIGWVWNLTCIYFPITVTINLHLGIRNYVSDHTNSLHMVKNVFLSQLHSPPLDKTFKSKSSVIWNSVKSILSFYFIAYPKINAFHVLKLMLDRDPFNSQFYSINCIIIYNQTGLAFDGGYRVGVEPYLYILSYNSHNQFAFRN